MRSIQNPTEIIRLIRALKSACSMIAAQLEEKSRNTGRPGSGLPLYGEITCWYKEDDLCDSIEEFCRHDLKRLKLVLDFAPVAVK